MIQREHTPRLIWELRLPISSKLHSKAFVNVCDMCYNVVYEPIYKNIVSSVSKRYE